MAPIANGAVPMTSVELVSGAGLVVVVVDPFVVAGPVVLQPQANVMEVLLEVPQAG